MPFITTIGTTSLFGFGLSLAVDRSAAYFYHVSDILWSNSASWYTEALHTNSSAFPTSNQTAYVLSNTEVELDGYLVDNTYFNWQTLSYWAPPAGITSVGEVDMLIISNKFYQAPAPIPVFADGNGIYSAGDIVEHPENSGFYYEAKATASNTSLVSNAPDPTYWGLVGPQPYVPSNCVINFGNNAVELVGVNNGTPV